MKTRRHGSSGQTLVIFTLVLVTLLGAMALCTDVAVLYFNWAQLQKAADAAAVAGAHNLPDETTATTTAFTYAAYNNVPSSQVVSVAFGNSDTTITVELQRTVNLFFARVFGFLNTPVTVRATAELVNVGGINGIFPIGLSCTGTSAATDCGCNSGWAAEPPCVLHFGMLSGAPGNWEPLAIGANGANQLRNSIAYGYQGTLTISDNMTLPTEPGNMMGPIAQGMTIRLNDSNFTNSDAPPTESQLNDTTLSPSYTNDSRLVMVPMVDFAGANGKTQVPVMGFALMWIQSFDRSNDAISVYFLQGVPPNGLPDGGAPSTGPMVPTLIN